MGEWVRICDTGDIAEEDVMRFDHAGVTYAVYHAPDGSFRATAGRCTHEDVHLGDGLVLGYLIECPKHNGQFDYRTGKARRAPACVDLRTFPVRVSGGSVYLEAE